MFCAVSHAGSPAAGQGAVGIEIRRADAETASALQTINHTATFQRVSAERALLHELEAGCQTPIGISTKINTAGQLEMQAIIFPEASQTEKPKSGQASGDPSNPTQLAKTLLAKLS